tara:strand:- start:809 stop:970 length:162 start_codon:yes stop_codon:yes gene_type:complete
MVSLGDVDIIVDTGIVHLQTKEIQEQIFSLYFGAEWNTFTKESMMEILESYKS